MVRNLKSRNRNLLRNCFIIATILLLTTGINSNIEYGNTQNSENSFSIEQVKTSDSFTSGLVIDNDGGGGITWATAKSTGYCTGTGTSTDPYIFENHDFLLPNGGGPCLWIQDSSVNFIVRNSAFQHESPTTGDDGIYLTNVENGQIINNDCSSNSYGIRIFGSFLSHNKYNTISNNNVKNNSAYGIHLNFVDESTISGNSVSLNEYEGLYLVDSCNNTVSGNTITQNKEDGLFLDDSDNNIIVQNSLSQNELNGIEILSSNQLIIFANTISSNIMTGIDMSQSDYNSISSNTISSNSESGIILDESDYNHIYGNTINSNAEYGLYLDTSFNNIIAVNTIVGNLNTIIETSDCEECNIIEANIFSSVPAGIPGYDLFVLLGLSFVSLGLILILINKRRFKSQF